MEMAIQLVLVVVSLMTITHVKAADGENQMHKNI